MRWRPVSVKADLRKHRKKINAKLHRANGFDAYFTNEWEFNFRSGLSILISLSAFNLFS